MEHLSVKKAINLARNFGAAGVLAAALVMTSGCSQADDRQIHALLVATSRLIKISRCYLAGLPPICRKTTSLRKGLRREANATVCRFLISMTCLPSK